MINITDLPELSYEGKPALSPQKDDLERLYNLIVDNFIVTVLEFGCGYSTLVIEQALKSNRNSFDSLKKKPNVRNSNMFKCFSVDTNEKWINAIKEKTDDEFVSFKWSFAYTGTYKDQMCSYYRSLPDIVPDLIYLDGPDPSQVRKNQNISISWECQERTPIAADILLMEPTLIPGTMIYVDGRTNNVRFLQRNLQRNWSYEYSLDEDYTLMILEENRLGKINVIGRDILEAIK